MKTRLFMMVICILLVKPQLFSVQLISDWQWANKLESPYVYGFGELKTTTDISGNTYVAGNFRDQLFFDDMSLQSQGTENLFLSKISSSGNWLWARNFRGSWNERPWERVEKIISVGDDIYMLGYTYFPITIDAVTIESNSASVPLGPFIAKFDASGICTMGAALNPSSAPQNHYVFFRHLAITSNSIYVGGSWTSPTTPIQFGQISVSGYDDGDSADSDILYAKMDLQGNLLWVKSIGGPSDEVLNDMCCDSSGNLYFGGEFSATMHAGSYQLTSSGFKDIFVTKIIQSGDVSWASKGGSTRDDTMTAFSQRNGIIFVTGNYANACSFGQLTLEPINTTASQYANAYVASINQSGTWLSVNRIGNSLFAFSMVSDILYDDNVYVLLPGLVAGNSYPHSFGDDFTWFPPDTEAGYGNHVIAGLNPQTNTWFGIAYASRTLGSYGVSLTSDNQSIYLATSVSDEMHFGSINVVPTMGSCYAFAKISKSEVVENYDEINTPTCGLNLILYPNPTRMNEGVSIEFQSKASSLNSIDVYNVRGQKVKSFSNLGYTGKIIWNGLDESSNACSSGLYFLVIRSGHSSLTKKVVITK